MHDIEHRRRTCMHACMRLIGCAYACHPVVLHCAGLMMERALVRLLRTHAMRASRFPLLQWRALRTSQHCRHNCVVGSSSDVFSRSELRDLSTAKTRPAWLGWSRGYAAGGAPNEIVVPFMGDSVPDGNLASILKKVGDSVAVDEIVAQIETDKVTIDVRSTVSGKIEQILAEEGDTVTPGTKVAIVAIGEAGAASAHATKAASPPPPLAPAAAAPPPPPKPAPSKAAAAPPPPPPPSKPAASKAPPPINMAAQVPQASQGGERRVAMTRLRERVATRLKDSQNTFALLTTFNEVDMSNIMQMRAQHKDAFIEKHGVKLGFMSGFVKAAVSALQQFPAVNAVIDGDDIIYRDYIDISVAVGTKKGLVVPVLRGVDHMNFAQIEKTINMLGKKANDGSLSIDEMAGGTFTISNGGTYGSLISTPIINPPQSAILGMHATKVRPVVVGKDIIARPMMYVALTYDHRLIDGREAVLFLRAVKDNVEDPRRLLLDI